MKTARNFFNWLNKHIFDKIGFRIIIIASKRRTMEMAREMHRSEDPGWIGLKKSFLSCYTLRADDQHEGTPLDALYELYTWKTSESGREIILDQVRAEMDRSSSEQQELKAKLG